MQPPWIMLYKLIPGPPLTSTLSALFWGRVITCCSQLQPNPTHGNLRRVWFTKSLHLPHLGGVCGGGGGGGLYLRGKRDVPKRMLHFSAIFQMRKCNGYPNEFPNSPRTFYHLTLMLLLASFAITNKATKDN